MAKKEQFTRVGYQQDDDDSDDWFMWLLIGVVLGLAIVLAG